MRNYVVLKLNNNSQIVPAYAGCGVVLKLNVTIYSRLK